MLAVAQGSTGDVIVIEQQICVCNLSCSNSSQQGLGPLEWDTPVFDAIQFAVAHGFVVVEAAGNGNVNLDQAACGTTFNRNVGDSGAIVVGAGGSPGSGADRQRLSFSSYGSRVDVQGQGDRVTTTGYGDLYRAAANITSPTQGSTFTSASVTFTWDTGTGVTQYWLYVGRTVGGSDLYNQSQGTSRSVTVNGLPTDGSTVYVRLWSLIGSAWLFKDYTYYRAVDTNFRYTGTFGGTSSASPIVAGAAADLNGIALQQHKAPLSSSQMRAVTGPDWEPSAGEHGGAYRSSRRFAAGYCSNGGAATEHLASAGIDTNE
jgi:Subtilase family